MNEATPTTPGDLARCGAVPTHKDGVYDGDVWIDHPDGGFRLRVEDARQFAAHIAQAADIATGEDSTR